MGACASDRSIILYDIRLATPMRKVIMELSTNAIAWNPMEAPTFVAANEDYNLYAFDMRTLKRPINVHMDHVSAVTCVDFAPTGREFVSGSYDKTVRIFPIEKVNQSIFKKWVIKLLRLCYACTFLLFWAGSIAFLCMRNLICWRLGVINNICFKKQIDLAYL